MGGVLSGLRELRRALDGVRHQRGSGSVALVTGVLLAAYVVWTLPGVRPSPGFSIPFDGVLQGGIYMLLAGLAVLGAYRAGSRAWWLVAGSLVLRALGFAITLAVLAGGRQPAYPSVADVAWVLATVLLAAALLVRLHQLAPRLPVLVVLDGLAAALLALGLVVAVLVGPVTTLVAGTERRAAVVVNLVYPLLDVVLLTVVTTTVTVAARRLADADRRLLVGTVAFAVVDVVYLVLVADGAWRPGTLVSSLSAVATAVVALSCWGAPRATPAARRLVGQRLPAVPSTGITPPAVLVVASLLLLAGAAVVPTSPASLTAYAAAGGVAVVRGLLTLRAERAQTGRALGEAGADLRRLQALVEASQDFVGLSDVEGRVLYLNAGARRLLGLRPDADVTLLRTQDLVPPSRRGEWDTERMPALLANGRWEGEGLAQPVDGRSLAVPVWVSTFVVDDPATGEPFAIGTIQRDLRERRRAEEARRALVDQRALLIERLVRAQEEERLRIAADVHDDPVQAIAVVDLRLALLRREVERAAPDVLPALDEAHASVLAASERLRHLLFDLESPARTAGLGRALEAAAAFVLDDSPTRWEVVADAGAELPEATRVVAYRIAKEALVNARRHAGAAHVQVTVRGLDGGVEVSVEDDGCGLPDDAMRPREGHLGLAAARDRAELAGGRLEVGPGSVGGTRISVWLPGAEAASS